MTANQNLRRIVTHSALVLTLLGVASLTSIGAAEEKGATRLMALSSTSVSETPSLASAQDASTAMSCPKCKVTQTTVTEATGKAVSPQIRHLVTQHECPSCSDTTVTTGHGKQAATKTLHACAEMGNNKASCCASK